MPAQAAQHEPAQPEPAPFDITAYPDDFLDCRAGRHLLPPGRQRKWRIAAVNPDGSTAEVSRACMCPSCKTIVREVIVVATGEKRRNAYRHPVGYRVPKKTGVTQRDFRREEVRRALDTIDIEAEED